MDVPRENGERLEEDTVVQRKDSICDRPYLCDEEKCMVLELERACYNEMERESMEYFYAAEKELQRQRERIRQLENILTENGIPVPEES